MEVEGYAVQGKTGSTMQLDFLRTNQDWKVMDWDGSISFNMALRILVFFFSLLASLGHYLHYNGSRWHNQTTCPFKSGFPWLTDTLSIPSIEHVAQPKPWMIPVAAQALCCTAFFRDLGQQRVKYVWMDKTWLLPMCGLLWR